MVFVGELMTCVCCQAEEKSSLEQNSNWRCLVVDGRPFYACPKEFPPDSSSPEAFKEAYKKIFNIISNKLLGERTQA